MEWKYEYCYGEKGPNEEPVEGDIVSSVEYDTTGQFLALGDRGGRVTVLERKRSRENGQKRESTEYRQSYRFQSHEPEFDYLKSIEIEEKINQIKWLRRLNQAQFLLTTNDKTVKLWKLHHKRQAVATFSSCPTTAAGSPPSATLRVPSVAAQGTAQASHSSRRVFANAHTYHINSISLNSDGETFLSADDLRVNLWYLDHTESLNIVDIKPANMEDLAEVITSASFHPQHCSLFLYSTSRGTMKMGDLRDAVSIDRYCKEFDVEDDTPNRTFFSEIISSISDTKFSRDGRYILARDYLTLKIWDINMERRPLKVMHIHEALRARLCDLYENDCIFDKFECAWSGDAKYVFTGSYKNHFKVADVSTITSTGTAQPQRGARVAPPMVTCEATKPKKQKKLGGLRKFGKTAKQEESYDRADFNKKVLHVAVHPSEPEIAVATVNNLFIFSSTP